MPRLSRNVLSLTTAAAIAGGLTVALAAQRPQFSSAVRGFIKVDAPLVALTQVRVIDGTGAPARENQTLILVVVNGDPSTTIADVRRVETVFKAGIGFDPAKLIESVKGRVGLW